MSDYDLALIVFYLIHCLLKIFFAKDYTFTGGTSCVQVVACPGVFGYNTCPYMVGAA